MVTNPSRLTFGRRSALSAGFQPVTFRLTTQVPTTAIFTRMEDDGWDVRILPTDRPNEYAGELRPTRPPQVGPHRICARLRLTSPDGAALPETELAIDGEVVPDVESYPRRLMFGGRAADTTAEEHLLIESLSGRSLRLIRVESTSLSLTAAADMDDVGPRQVVRVRWRVDSGPLEAAVTVHYEVDGGHRESIRVIAQATGFGP